MKVCTPTISTEEQKLIKMVNANNSLAEISALLSLRQYKHLQDTLWYTHKDNVGFINMWVEHLDKQNISNRPIHVLLRPTYVDKVIKMFCIRRWDGGRNLVEVRTDDKNMTFDDMSRDKSRIQFLIEPIIPSDLYEESLHHVNFSRFYFMKHLLHKEDISNILTLPNGYFDIKVRVMSNIPYYSQHARLKAIEYCNTVSVLKDLLNDIDAQIREAALKKISTTNKLTKEMIYKMLESDDVEVRLKGLSLLKEQNKD